MIVKHRVRLIGRRGRRLAAPIAVVALLAAGCGEGDAPERERPAPSPAQAEATVERAQRAPADVEAAPPTAIAIPAIAVRAPVIRLGLNPDRTLEVPKGYHETGWWSGGHAPGERGPAVIAGHVDSKQGPAVFHRLDRLARGDRIRIDRADGSSVAYAVERLERHPKDGFPTRAVYGGTARSTLRLVTCSGDFDAASGHYTDNTIVFAARVSRR